MRYLNEQDFAALITPEELAVISQDTVGWQLAESTAMELVAGYLRGRYDVEQTWRQVGDKRNPMIVHTLMVLTIWQCIHRLPERMGYERWEALHEDAVKYLEDIQRGRTNPNLPTLLQDEGGEEAKGIIRIGGMPRSTYHY